MHARTHMHGNETVYPICILWIGNHGTYPRGNHLCKFWSGSVKGFGTWWGFYGLPIYEDCCPYNTVPLPCKCVIVLEYGGAAAERERSGERVLHLQLNSTLL